MSSVFHHQLVINPSMIVACCSSCLKCIAFPESLLVVNMIMNSDYHLHTYSGPWTLVYSV